MGFIRKYFVPHYSNGFRPYSTRYYTLVIYCFTFLILNLFAYPLLGITSGHVLASNISSDDLIGLTNKERRARGLNELTKNGDLIRAAVAKGNDMFANQYWSHFGPAGQTPWQFILGSGYNYVYAGENLAKDFSTSLEAHLAWMNSPTHRENILNANFKDVGIAVVSGKLNGKSTTIVVELFGARTAASQPKAATKTATTATPKKAPTSTPAPLPTKSPIETYVPSLNEPEHNSTFRLIAIKLSGEANYGDTIKVFSNDKLIGELPKDANNFTISENFPEGANQIYIKSKETSSGKESLPSNMTNIIIDTTPPDPEKVHVDFYHENSQVTVTVNPEEHLESVDAVIRDKTVTLSPKDESFYFSFDPSGVDSITLTFYDGAGNVASKNFSLSEVIKEEKSAPSFASVGSTDESPRIPSLNSYFSKTGTREKINFALVIGFLTLMLVDAVVVIRKGHVRQWASHHGFHIALVMVMMVGLMTI